MAEVIIDVKIDVIVDGMDCGDTFTIQVEVDDRWSAADIKGLVSDSVMDWRMENITCYYQYDGIN